MSFIRWLIPTSDLPRPSRVNVTVLSAEPLHPEPAYSTADDFAEPSAYRISFGARGPLLAVSKHALQQSVEHVSERISVESGGACLGRVYRGPGDRLLISLEEIVRAENTEEGAVLQGSASLTMMPEAWRSMIQISEIRFPWLRILGWYHSHPGFGVFLSPTDLFSHNNFFTEPWHIAMVIDPHKRQAGFFVRKRKGLSVSGLEWNRDTNYACPLPLGSLKGSLRMTRLCQLMR